MINEKDAHAAIAAEQAARKNLKDHTLLVVSAMRAAGRSKDFADGYMDGVTTGLEVGVSIQARLYFEEAWAATAE